MAYPANYHTILYDEYPEIHELWCEAVNADFGTEELYEQGKLKEAEELYKFHEEKWAEYVLATKLIFEGSDEKASN